MIRMIVRRAVTASSLPRVGDCHRLRWSGRPRGALPDRPIRSNDPIGAFDPEMKSQDPVWAERPIFVILGRAAGARIGARTGAFRPRARVPREWQARRP